MATGFEGFCGGNLSENSSYFVDQRLTICMRTTLCYWVPFVCYAFLLPFWIKMIYSRKIPPLFLNRSRLYITKTCLSVSLVIMSVVMIICGFVANSNNDPADQDVAPAYFLLWFLFIPVLLSTIYVATIERLHGKYSSMLMFVFHLAIVLASITNLPKFYDDEHFQAINTAFYVFFALLSIQFIVFLFPESHEYAVSLTEEQKNSSPENFSGVIQKLYFTYVTRLINKGYKRALEVRDLWFLSDNEKSAVVSASLRNEWTRQVNKHSKFLDRHDADQDVPGKLQMDKKNTEDVSFATSQQLKFVKALLKGERSKPSIAWALFLAFKGKILASAFLKVIYDLMQFVPPLILGWILDFLQSDQQLITGIMFCLLMLANSSVQSCILHQYFHRMTLVGQRFRTSLITLVYEKSLRLSPASRQKSTVGEIVNLMSVDAQRLLDLTNYMQIIWSGPFQIILAIVFLWTTMGPSILAGVAILVLAIPLNTWIASRLKKYQTIHMQLKDVRIKDMNEILNGIKVIKLYAWEKLFVDKVSDTRKKELVVLRKTMIFNAMISLVWTITPFLVSVVTFAVYVAVSPENVLTAKKVFVALSLFDLLRFPLFMLAAVLTNFVQAKVSVSRIENFLLLEEVRPDAVEYKNLEGNAIEIHNGTFGWSKSEVALADINMNIANNSLVAVVGDVGSGKTALLQSILGEMEKSNGSVYLDGHVAYVPQQAWILNETVRKNIIMMKPYNEKLYSTIVEACALAPDFKILPAGDATEIGERGITLSGGQKQRISLARAIYANADVYLLDDPLSAVDSHVAKHIFSKVVDDRGLLGKKTRIFVTNALSYLPKCDRIVHLRKGQISEDGKFNDLLAANNDLASLVRQYLQDLTKEGDEDDQVDTDHAEDLLAQLSEEQKAFLEVNEPEIAFAVKEKKKRKLKANKMAKKAYKRLKSVRKSIIELGKSSKDPAKSRLDKNVDDGRLKHSDEKLMTVENIETTAIKGDVVKKYFWSYGISLVIFCVLFVFNIVSQFGYKYWLSELSANAEAESNDTSKTTMRIGVYAALGIAYGAIYFACEVALLVGAFKASVRLHSGLLNKCMRATMTFFDTTPIGRIINRFSKDIDAVDYSLPSSLRSAISTFTTIVTTIIIISISNPYFLIAVPPVAVIFFIIQRRYIASSRQLRRLESVTRSPIYSHFSETIQGLQSIRAFKLNEPFADRNYELNDINIRTYYPAILVNRWLAMILETIANLIVFLTCILGVTVDRNSENSGIIGLAISNALGITQSLNWVVRMISEIETNVVAVERVLEYCEVESEPDWINDNYDLDDQWPDKGQVSIEDYSLKYREHLEPALKSITMKIGGSEKIGVVGRTGAGKSSLTVGLFRLVETTTGSIRIDDVPIKEIGLHQLRQKITVLPQDPVIFSGTIRSNLDPFNTADEKQIWDALKNSSLDEFVRTLPGQLDYLVSESGENFSVGQRQLFCLSRALLRKTKLLVLDEATAAVDVETDDVIQNTIRSEFKGCTVLTIAHRLNTIMDYDKIAVFDHGQLKEFDSPKNLLADSSTIFSSLVHDANLKVAESDNDDRKD